MPDLEHPDITQANKTGYPNMTAQPEHFGIDYTGEEVLTGDQIVISPDGELILKSNLEEYLSLIGFKFQTAE